MAINIAVDGPAASGKSSLAKALAQKLGYMYLGTGELYRAVGYYMVKNYPQGYTTEDIISSLKNINIKLQFNNSTQNVILNGEAVSAFLDEDDFSLAASQVSKSKEVRDFLLDLQRDLAKNNNIVMDGRDIGTVILPNAQVKFFLTASPEVRATRRYNQLKAANKKADYNEILANIIERDKNDTTRELAPLKKAYDAIELDNTEYDFNTNLEHMYKLFLEKDVVE